MKPDTFLIFLLIALPSMVFVGYLIRDMKIEKPKIVPETITIIPIERKIIDLKSISRMHKEHKNNPKAQQSMKEGFVFAFSKEIIDRNLIVIKENKDIYSMEDYEREAMGFIEYIATIEILQPKENENIF